MLTLKCDHCGGKVMEDIESSKYIDLHCIYCAKRWFIPRLKYRRWLKELDKKLTAGRKRRFVVVG